MAVPYGTRFDVDFDLVFPQGAYIIGEATGLRAVDVNPAKSAAA